MCDDADIVFEYVLEFPDGERQNVVVRLDPLTQALQGLDGDDGAPWTRIESVGCSECPLRRTRTTCPVARALSDLVARFDHRFSYDTVSLVVKGPERTYQRSECALQNALSSLTGIYMVTAGCPIFDKLRPMVRFHLPLATEQETVFRAVGMYLIAQHLRSERGLPADPGLAGLLRVYRDVHEANRKLASAIMSWAEHDASANALVRLDLFTADVAWSVEDSLRDLAYLFDGSYL